MGVYWLEKREESVPQGNEWLSEREIATLEGMHIAKRRNDWRLGRWTAKLAISAYLHLPDDMRELAAIEARPAPSGAPQAFLDGRNAGISLSLSHSHGVGFCAVGGDGMDLGCDVETAAPHTQTFLEDYFTSGEQALVAGIPPVQQEMTVTLLWSAKESALKAIGCGLRADTRSVTVKPADLWAAGGAWNGLAVQHSCGQVFHGWWRVTGDLVWTVLASPPPEMPIALSKRG